MTTEPEAWATEVDPNTTISIFWNQKVDPKTAHKFVKVQYAVTKYKKVKTTVEVESTENVLVLRPEKPLPFSALITVVIKPTPAIEGPLMPNLLYSFIFNTRKAKCTMEDPIHKSLTERKHTF